MSKLLQELTKLSTDFAAKEIEQRNQLSEKKRAELEAKEEGEFWAAINGLEKRLKLAALEGDRKYVVFITKDIYTDTYFHKELWKMVGKSGNMLCAWRDKVIQQKDVEKYMKSSFRRIFNELVSMELNPIIEHWWDGCNEEGFQIIVKW